MKFDSALIDGVLIRRYKRFLADVTILETGATVLVHVPNPGAMTGVKDPGSPCRISVSKNLSRKIPYTLEMVKTQEGSWVGINTSLTNHLVQEAFEKKIIPSWINFSEIKREVKVGQNSRLDFLFSNPDTRCFVEVKNVSMARPPHAVFPDSVTERGQKHLRELMELSKAGHLAEIFFVVQREDCHVFKPCDDVDPKYGSLLRQAALENVTVRCWSCELTPTSICVARELRIDLS